MLLLVPLACLFIVSTIGSFINNSSHIILVTLRISLVHFFSHSLLMREIKQIHFIRIKIGKTFQ
jgi:hypothetical protein